MRHMSWCDTTSRHMSQHIARHNAIIMTFNSEHWHRPMMTTTTRRRRHDGDDAAAASEDVVELVAQKVVVVIVLYARVRRDHRVLRPDVHRVVHFPVDVAHLARRVEQALCACEQRGVNGELRTGECERGTANGGVWTGNCERVCANGELQTAECEQCEQWNSVVWMGNCKLQCEQGGNRELRTVKWVGNCERQCERGNVNSEQRTVNITMWKRGTMNSEQRTANSEVWTHARACPPYLPHHHAPLPAPPPHAPPTCSMYCSTLAVPSPTLTPLYPPHPLTPPYLQRVLQHLGRAQPHPHALDAAHERLDDVRRRLEDVRPDVVEEVREGVLAAEAVHAEGDVLDGGHRRLTVHQVPARRGEVHQRTPTGAVYSRGDMYIQGTGRVTHNLPVV